MGVAFFVALTPIWETDIFWHITVGRSILDEGRLPVANIWSAADPAQPYDTLYWLYDLFVAWIDRRLGLPAVRWVHAVWFSGTLAGFYAALRGLKCAPSLATLFALLLLAAFHDRIRLRPHLFGFTFDLLLTFAVIALHRLHRWLWLYAFLAFFVWASLHNIPAWSGLLGLLALSALILIYEHVVKIDQLRGRALMLTLGAALGCVVAPASLDWVSTFRFEPVSYIDEFLAWPAVTARQSGARLPHGVLARLFSPAALIGWLIVAWRWWNVIRLDPERRRVQGAPRELILALFFVVLSLGWWRFFYFGALALLLLYVAWKRLSEDPPRERVVQRTPSKWASVRLALASTAVTVITVHYEALDYPSFGTAIEARATTVDARYFPTLTTALLAESGIRARIGTIPNWGGYILYHGWPRLSVTIDGRFVAPPVVSAVTHQIVEIRQTGQNAHHLPALYAQLPADFLVMPAPAFLGGAVPEDWVRIASGPTDDLYARRSPHLPEWIARLREVAARHGALPKAPSQ